MVEVRRILDQYWVWVVKNVTHENWQKGEEVIPWLHLQKQLSHAGLLENNYHHPILFRVLARQYLSLGQSQLELDKLLFMLTRSGALISYVERGELPGYPMVQLNASIAKIERLHLGHEIEKLKAKTTILVTLFYLLHRCCTVEQLALIPQLIYYRLHTTDEERDSEMAIFTSLCSDIPVWQAFFARNNYYVDTNTFRNEACLKEIASLIPTARLTLLHAVDNMRWIYSFIYQSRQLKILDENQLLAHTIQLFRKEFATLQDRSYSAALDFAAEIRRQINCLTEKEANLVHDALYTFCLHVYEEERPRDKFANPFALSGKTKCNAAEKKRKDLAGFPIKYGFLEVIALKQGRLGALVNMFEGDGSNQKLV
ncbi:hypothetical protein [Legionella tunisiensis]|uniref:hypothetical protein n=1 Tax=Legionella tunisiensis TaxID=1034944 RepID=UPI00030314D5|nr:hypothetical protein [Legionella tunisiensis]